MAAVPPRAPSRSIFFAKELGAHGGILSSRLGLQYLSSPLNSFHEVWRHCFSGARIANLIGSSRMIKEENIKLADLWDMSREEKIVFMVIDVKTTDANASLITDLGLTAWTPGAVGIIQSQHWHIDELSYNEMEPDTFDFGTTQNIASSDIGTVLDDWVLSFRVQHRRICLVFYGSNTLCSLEKQWPIPSDVLLLDAQKIWQLQQHQETPISLDEIFLSARDFEYRPSTLHNLGNRSYLLMLILQRLGDRADNWAKDSATHVAY
ncbi:hypothetical protein SCAR479_05014 [Seiridium cardinale]|uniref:Gfd2/YDR514C-like C-terminal domain-containing protein n=1 Tax=Seiridium cardinale TaxID=138064 RepID=A0ABR2Y5T2_9PEZI